MFFHIDQIVIEIGCAVTAPGDINSPIGGGANGRSGDFIGDAVG
jgi:hypothetical protein